jgi:hypothetical protein
MIVLELILNDTIGACLLLRDAVKRKVGVSHMEAGCGVTVKAKQNGGVKSKAGDRSDGSSFGGY